MTGFTVSRCSVLVLIYTAGGAWEISPETSASRPGPALPPACQFIVCINNSHHWCQMADWKSELAILGGKLDRKKSHLKLELTHIPVRGGGAYLGPWPRTNPRKISRSDHMEVQSCRVRHSPAAALLPDTLSTREARLTFCPVSSNSSERHTWVPRRCMPCTCDIRDGCPPEQGDLSFTGI